MEIIIVFILGMLLMGMMFGGTIVKVMNSAGKDVKDIIVSVTN